MKVIIVGGGKTMFFLGRNFAAKGYRVVIINRNMEECEELAKQLKAVVIFGDGSNAGTLEDAGMMSADAVLAITPHDQDNLVICQLAASQFKVPRAIALANDPDNVKVFEKLGIQAFSTTHIVSSLIEQRATFEEITNLMPLGEGKVNITELVIGSKSPVAGKQLKDICLPDNSLIAVIIRSNQSIVPRGPNELHLNDRVVVITLPENHGKVLKMLTGEE